MPSLTFPRTTADGPLVEVSLMPSTRVIHARGQWSLPPSTFKMLIDSGADHTSVDASVIAPWGLHAGTAFKSQTMGGIVAARAYDVALSIRDSKGNLVIQFDPLPVVARRNSPFDGLPFLGLLGRDVLDRGVFFYNGKGTYCTLAF